MVSVIASLSRLCLLFQTHCVLLDCTSTEARSLLQPPKHQKARTVHLAFMSLCMACTLAMAWSAFASNDPAAVLLLAGLACGTYFTGFGAYSCNSASSSAIFASSAEFLSLREAFSSWSILITGWTLCVT